jgi:hypothetical protein
VGRLDIPVDLGRLRPLAIPDDPVFAGVHLWHQVVQVEFTPSGQFASMSSSNALTLALGLL